MIKMGKTADNANPIRLEDMISNVGTGLLSDKGKVQRAKDKSDHNKMIKSQHQRHLSTNPGSKRNLDLFDGQSRYTGSR